MRMFYFVFAWAAVFIASSTAVFAHTGVHSASGFSNGFAHPIGGLDPLLAMLTVGLLAAQLGRTAVWLVPLTFVGLMAVGASLGAHGVFPHYIEAGVALSLLCFGAVYAFGLSLPITAAMALTAFFAIFHGYAHGAETPTNVSGLAYGGGFVMATALLHATGLVVGLRIKNLQNAGMRMPVQRLIGASVAGAGVWFLAFAI